jgi:hypothetical protein
MGDRPAFLYLDALRKLRGEPHVSSPENNAGVLKSERVRILPRTAPRPNYGDPEPNAVLAAAGCALTHIEELGGDNLNVELYLVYETIPGTLLSGTQLDERGDEQTVQTQIVAKGTAADAATILREGSVEAVDNVRSRKVTRAVASHSTLTGAEFDEDGALVSTADDIVAPGTAPADGLLVVSDAVEPLTKQKSRRVRKTVASHPVIASAGLNERGEETTTIEQTVAAGTSADADGLLVDETLVKGLTATKSRKKKTVVSARVTLGGSQVNERGEVVTVADSIIAPGSAAAADGLLVESDAVTDQSTTKARRVRKTVASRVTLGGQSFNAPADGLLVDSDVVSDLSAAKAKRVRKTVGSRVTLTTVDLSKVPRQSSVLPPKFLSGEQLTETRQIVAPDTSPDDLSTTVLTSKVEQQTLTKAEKTTLSRPAQAYPVLTGTELSRAADGTPATVTARILTGPGNGTFATVTGGFGVLSDEVQPLSKEYAQQTTMSVTAFPALSGAKQLTFGTSYPGKYGIQGEEVRILWDQKVAVGTLPTGDAWTAMLAANPTALTERKNVDAYTDQIIVKKLIENGVTDYPGQVLTQWGVADRTHTLGGVVETGPGVLASETQPAGNGMLEAVTTRIDSPQPVTGKEYKVNVPERMIAGLTLTTSRTLVAAGSAPDIGTTVLSSSVKGKDQANSEKETVTLPSNVASLSPVTDKEYLSERADGETVTLVKNVVPTATPALPTIDHKTLVLSLRDIGGGYSEKNVGTVEAYPLLKGERIDEETGGLIKIEKQIVDAAGTPISSYTGGREFEEHRPIDKYKSLYIKTTYSLPASYEDTDEITYQFPALFYSYSYVSDLGSFSLVRDAFSKTVNARVVYSWTATKQSMTFFDVTPTGWSFPQGFSFRNVLSDGGTYAGTQNGISFSVPFPASSPTRSDYEALIGSEQLIGGYSKRVRPTMWKNKFVHIYLL